MLFNSYEFILLFLPVTLGIYYFLGKHNYRIAITWLVAASLFFYSWWNPAYLPLILLSMMFNYAVGTLLSGRARSRKLLTFGIVGNLGALGYFKYTNFLVDNANILLGTGFNIQKIVLPLAISFFTFQQIAFLVDAYRGETREYSFLQYALFVTFFPQLIVGPIVHHREMLPQFTRQITSQINPANFVVGISIFVIGLFKKVGLADDIAVYAEPVFYAAARGAELTFCEAWGGILAYTLQLYFDFSGYMDMAIGAALMFGIRLPMNFNSPYKSTSIIEFWRRWHITLGRFLLDYLYIPLGGSRKGYIRTKVNMMITMVLCGFWHGAGWTYVIFGVVQGFYMLINQLWRETVGRLIPSRIANGYPMRLICIAVTFTFFVASLVIFRADDLEAAYRVLVGMSGYNGIAIPVKYLSRWGEFGTMLQSWGLQFDDNLFNGSRQTVKILEFLFLVWLLPNTQTIMRKFRPVVETITQKSRIVFKPHLAWLCLIYGLAIVSILKLGEVSEFLYFNF